MSEKDWVDDPEIIKDDWVDDQPSEKPTSRPMEAGLEGLAQGATLGYADELRALTEPAVFGALNLITGNDVESDDYLKSRDAYEKRQKTLAKENPAAFMTGQVAGSVASGAAMAPLTSVNAATALGRAGQAAIIGGIIGAAQDVDNAEGEYSVKPWERAKNALVGGITGGVLQGGSEIAKKAPGAINDAAEWLGAKALGAERGTIKSIGADKVKDLGRYALDEGLLSPLASTDDIIARNDAIKKSAGEQMGKVYQAIDEKGLSTFNPLEVASKLDEKLAPTFRTPINKGEVNQFENTLETILTKGDKNIPLEEAQKLKELLGTASNWKNKLNISPKEEMARDAYRLVSNEIDNAVNSGAKQIGSGDILETLKNARKTFARGSTADQLLENKLAREQGNKLFGLTDVITGGSALGYGGMTGDWETAAGVMAAKKGIEKYGAQNSAILLDKISKALMKSPQMSQVYQSNPMAFQSIVKNLAQKIESNSGAIPKAAEKQEQQSAKLEKEEIINKLQGSKYSQVLQNAAQKGDQSFNAAHYVLSQRDPEYRKHFETQGR